MKKLTKVLAASVTAGLLAGAGFRLGETITAGRAELNPSPGRGTGNEPGSTTGLTAEESSSLAQRVARLEKEVASHSEGLSELRECSLRTERTMQKLLLSIDRLIPLHASLPLQQREETVLSSRREIRLAETSH